MIKKFIAIFCLLLPLWCWAWPTKDITIIVPYGAGGPSDVVARSYKSDLERMFNVRVEIKYLPGASTLVAVNHMLATSNDNHTFMVTADDFVTGTVANGNKLYEKFAPVVITGSFPFVLFGNADANSERFKQQIHQGKQVNVATLGINGSADIWLSNLKSNLQMTSVPYKARSTIMTDIIGGHVEYSTMSLITATTFLTDKQIVPMMISSDSRHPLLPNTPTFKELGFRGESWTSWWAVVTRRDTEQNALMSMNSALREINKQNSNIQAFTKNGLRILNLNQTESEKYLESELSKTQKFIK